MDNYDWLNQIVKCPKCHEDVKDGDRIWLDGECLCPKCYLNKREDYDRIYKQGLKDGKNSCGNCE